MQVPAIVPQVRGETKCIIFKGEKHESSVQKAEEAEAIPFSGMMEHEERKEIHLSKALKSNSDIPTPDVIQIDEQIYDKLYPMTSLSKKRFYSLLTAVEGEVIEYDIDSSDQGWLSQHSKWKIAPEKFERCMEWLENECELKVPSLDSLLVQSFVGDMDFFAIEGIYDHWLNKRLEGKQKLLHRVKQENKRKRTKLLKADDPYLAFRQCQEKMHTRKNRLAEQENFVKMLRGRREIYQWYRIFLDMRDKQAKKLQTVKMKISMFDEQYKTQNFIEPHLTYPVKFLEKNSFESIFGYDDSDDPEEEPRCDTSLESDENDQFEFVPREGCQYHVPIHEDSGLGWSDSSGDSKKFCRTTEGVRRKRIGRGGRILFDRRSHDSISHPEYETIDSTPVVLLDPLPTTEESFDKVVSFEDDPNYEVYEVVMEPVEDDNGVLCHEDPIVGLRTSTSSEGLKLIDLDARSHFDCGSISQPDFDHNCTSSVVLNPLPVEESFEQLASFLDVPDNVM